MSVKKVTLQRELDKILETMLNTPVIVETMATQHVIAAWRDGTVLMLSVTTEDSKVAKYDC